MIGMKTVRSLIRLAGFFLGLLILFAVGFLVAAAIGAFIPREFEGAKGLEASAGGLPSAGEQTVTIYLLTSLLHTDIAVPVSDDLLERFPGLLDTRLPIGNPRLKYLGFGWGSEAFYTTAGEYTDIKVATAWKAATGDRAIMRVTGLPDLQPGERVIALNLPPKAYQRLLTALESGFKINDAGKWIYHPQYSIGVADAFYAGKGHFNLLNPCNQWTGDVLSYAGVKAGWWTPTSYSLIWSLHWNN